MLTGFFQSLERNSQMAREKCGMDLSCLSHSRRHRYPLRCSTGLGDKGPGSGSELSAWAEHLSILKPWLWSPVPQKGGTEPQKTGLRRGLPGGPAEWASSLSPELPCEPASLPPLSFSSCSRSPVSLLPRLEETDRKSQRTHLAGFCQPLPQSASPL